MGRALAVEGVRGREPQTKLVSIRILFPVFVSLCFQNRRLLIAYLCTTSTHLTHFIKILKKTRRLKFSLIFENCNSVPV